MMTREAMRGYLLEKEEQAGTVEVHRHKILLAFPAIVLLAALVAAVAFPVAWWGILPAAGWVWWRWLNWRCYWFALTTKRIVVARGVFSHEVGLMPLNRLTDMSFRESWVGQRFGWATIVVESAGQDQALHIIRWLPRGIYLEISEQLFGGDSEDLG